MAGQSLEGQGLMIAARRAVQSEEPPPMPTARSLTPEGWGEEVGGARESVLRGQPLKSALAEAARAAEAIHAAVGIVVEPNVPPLMEHVRTVVEDKCAAAVRALQREGREGGGVTESRAMLAAREVFGAVGARISRSEGQFVEGLCEGVSPGVRHALGEDLLLTLCEQAVGQVCAGVRQMVSEEELHARIWEEVEVGQSFVSAVSEKGGQQWLCEVLLGSVTVQMPSVLYDFICTVRLHILLEEGEDREGGRRWRGFAGWSATRSAPVEEDR